MKPDPIHHWNPGDVVVTRGVWRHKVHWACAGIVVRDTPGLVAIYRPAGTPNWIPAKRSTRPDFLTNDIRLVPHHWTDTDVLSLAEPAAAHAVELMWEAGRKELRCWYVNLQEPLRRTRLGFDSMDQLLDLVISPERSAWHWKDEEEFNEAVALGVYPPEQARAIRAEGERVIARLQARQSPFYDGWENWRPPRGWEIPPLLAGWDDLSEESSDG